MSCMLHISGEEFYVDSFLEESQLSHTVYKIHHKGEARSKNVERWGYFEHNGCSFITSNADFKDYPLQVSDTIGFLKANFESLSLLTSTYKIDSIELDFGIETAFTNNFNDRHTIPNELLKLCAPLGIDITMSNYLPSKE